MRIAASPLRSLRVAAVLAAGLGALVHANTLRNDFAYDDVPIVRDNAQIRTLAGLPDAMLEPYWPGDFAKELGLWRPVTTGLLGLEYAISGDDAVLYHAVNVLAHAGVTAMVVVVLAQLMPLAAAFVAGLVFAVHPVHVEAVANVVGISELVGALFSLWAILLHLRSGDRTGWGRALAIAALFALAFGAKESAAALPGLLFLVDAARRRIDLSDLPDYVRRRWRPYLAMSLVAAVMLVVRFRVLGSLAHPLAPLGADMLRRIPRIWTLAEVWSHYVRLLVFPLDLSADYSPNVIPVALGWHANNLVGLSLSLALLGIALATWRGEVMSAARATSRTVAFGIVWFVISIAPVANVFFLSGILLAERTLYFPSIGFAAAAGWAVVVLARTRPRASWALAAVAVALLGWRTWLRNPTWKDSPTTFSRLIDDYPHSGRAQWLLGLAFYRSGRVEQSLVSFRAAVGILGAHYQLLVEIGRRLIDARRYDSAERLLRMAFDEEPDIPIAAELLAVAYSQQGRVEETERFCRIVLDLDDGRVVPYHLLAWALAAQGRWTEAADARLGAIERGEGGAWEQWTSLAYLRTQAGDTTAARAALDSALLRAESRSARREVDSLRAVYLGPADPPLPR